MACSEASRAVRVGTAADGTVTYLVDVALEALPPVRSRDISAAWDAARDAAIAAGAGSGAITPGPAAFQPTARVFRFNNNGDSTDLALADADACCWAGAVDRTVGRHTSYGLSLCLRLLALVDLLSRATWARALISLRRDGADIDPSVLRAAAVAPLTRDARFDETTFRSRVGDPALAPPIRGVSA